MEGKPFIKLSLKMLGTILIAIIGILLLGIGLCSVMVWNALIIGIIIGIIGIIMLIALIPLVKGLK
nr:hypothetical protein [uncultured Cellulosilyticum sp.]